MLPDLAVTKFLDLTATDPGRCVMAQDRALSFRCWVLDCFQYEDEYLRDWLGSAFVLHARGILRTPLKAMFFVKLVFICCRKELNVPYVSILALLD